MTYMTTMMTNEVGCGELSPIVAQAVAYTKAYKKFAEADPAMREAMCLREQYPASLGTIRAGDMIAGRRPAARITYVGTITWMAYPGGKPGARSEGKQGGYCYDFAAWEKYGKTEAEKKVLTEMEAFWEKESTWGKIRQEWDEETIKYARGDGQIMGGGCGSMFAGDLDRLVQRGIPGLLEDIETYKAKAKKAGEETVFFDAMKIAVEVLVNVCEHYREQALAMIEETQDEAEKKRLRGMEAALRGITEHRPETFQEAVQLVWIYTLIGGAKHIDVWRLDVALGDLLAQDIDSGKMSEEEAVELVCAMWRLFNENGEDAVCRVVVGGMARRNVANADRFAMAAMEATRRHKRVTPQLTLRFCKGQNPKLMDKAFEVLGEGCTYPMLYNDDVIVPGVMKLFGVSEEDAIRYHPLGCGEYMLAACSPSILNVVWSVPKTVEAVLFNGKTLEGTPIGLETGTPESLDTFEKFYAAFLKQTAFTAKIGARIYQYNIEHLPKYVSYLYASLLTDDCLARGKAMWDGGARYMGACIMGHGFTNAADSLTAIRKLVYQEKRVTLAELVTAMKANFEGYEGIRKMLMEAPKFGNDNEDADRMLADMWRHINEAAKAAGKEAGMAFLTVSSVNPGGYGVGAACGATADGRLKGEPFAIGHAPTAGFDKKGLTAMFNSVAKIDPANGGATTSVKLGSDWFTGSKKGKAQDLFKAYFAKGGMQATVTVVNRSDLEAALKEPEKYPHLLVRVGGWSARFIDLEKRVQMEILRRTQY